MSSDSIEPQLGAESFSCPHYNAVAHHDWYSLFLKPENATDVVALTLEALMLASPLRAHPVSSRPIKPNALFENNLLFSVLPRTTTAVPGLPSARPNPVP